MFGCVMCVGVGVGVYGCACMCVCGVIALRKLCGRKP